MALFLAQDGSLGVIPIKPTIILTGRSPLFEGFLFVVGNQSQSRFEALWPVDRMVSTEGRHGNLCQCVQVTPNPFQVFIYGWSAITESLSAPCETEHRQPSCASVYMPMTLFSLGIT